MTGKLWDNWLANISRGGGGGGVGLFGEGVVCLFVVFF